MTPNTNQKLLCNCIVAHIHYTHIHYTTVKAAEFLLLLKAVIIPVIMKMVSQIKEISTKILKQSKNVEIKVKQYFTLKYDTQNEIVMLYLPIL